MLVLFNDLIHNTWNTINQGSLQNFADKIKPV